MTAYQVSLRVDFSPPLTIARQQQVMDALAALDPDGLEVGDGACELVLRAEASRSEAARVEAEDAVARVLASAGHTMRTAPISTTAVVAAGREG